jgi:predicted KAP-like P-loop ATPase
MKKVKEVQQVQEVVKTGKELLADAIAALTPEQLALIYPPIQRANFVVRKSWLGRNQVITFVNNKNQRVTYNHDDVLNVMLPKLSIMPCWIKREYWSQSTDMPSNVRHLATIEDLDVIDQELSDLQNQVAAE